MAKKVTLDHLGDAIAEELTVYHEGVLEAVDKLSETAVKGLVKKTRPTAPVGARGSFKKNISSKCLEKTKRGSKYVWYVKAPDHRLTHLIVKGHATKNGGRTKGDPFLQNALGEVLPEYEKAVKEALQNGQ